MDKEAEAALLTTSLLSEVVEEVPGTDLLELIELLVVLVEAVGQQLPTGAQEVLGLQVKVLTVPKEAFSQATHTLVLAVEAQALLELRETTVPTLE
jgi:hypothetical protein